eukprot:7112597-Prymnesium_polylepis.1
MLRWMLLYFPVWVVTCLTAFWSCHPTFNPMPVVPGNWQHYIASAVFVLFRLGLGSRSPSDRAN